MPPRSKVHALPVEVKAWLDRALAENNFSEYEALSAELAARGHAISKSALNRYGQGFAQSGQGRCRVRPCFYCTKEMDC
jgi:hypothetical protein